MRRLALVPALVLLGAAGCSSGDGHHAEHPVRVVHEMPVVSASQLAELAREQAAAEKHALRVLRVRPAGSADPAAWRTVATSHDDHRLLLAVSVGACDEFLGVLVTDTPERVAVEPLVRKPSPGMCVDRLDTFVGYIDFPAAIAARMDAAASS